MGRLPSVEEILELLASGKSKKDVADMFGVTAAAVSRKLPPEHRRHLYRTDDVVPFPVRPEHVLKHPFRMLRAELAIKEGRLSEDSREAEEVRAFRTELETSIWIYDSQGVRRVPRTDTDPEDAVFRSAS